MSSIGFILGLFLMGLRAERSLFSHTVCSMFCTNDRPYQHHWGRKAEKAPWNTMDREGEGWNSLEWGGEGVVLLLLLRHLLGGQSPPSLGSVTDLCPAGMWLSNGLRLCPRSLLSLWMVWMGFLWEAFAMAGIWLGEFKHLSLCPEPVLWRQSSTGVGILSKNSLSLEHGGFISLYKPSLPEVALSRQLLRSLSGGQEMKMSFGNIEAVQLQNIIFCH